MAMTIDDVLAVRDETIFAKDGEPGTLPDATQVGGVLRRLQTRRAPGFDAYTFDPVAHTIAPDLTDAHGDILALAAACAFLSAEYRRKLNSGEFGISWESGLEAESSISASKEYKAMLDALEQEVDRLILIQNSNRTGFRSQ